MKVVLLDDEKLLLEERANGKWLMVRLDRGGDV